MPRKGPAPKRPVVADPVYGSPVVSQLVNKILVDGKKDLAQRIVYEALENVATKSGQDAVATLKKALDNVRPLLDCQTHTTLVKRGGARSLVNDLITGQGVVSGRAVHAAIR
jgi:ribosomal protein S7